jgi:hypothetical protein
LELLTHDLAWLTFNTAPALLLTLKRSLLDEHSMGSTVGYLYHEDEPWPMPDIASSFSATPMPPELDISLKFMESMVENVSSTDLPNSVERCTGL